MRQAETPARRQNTAVSATRFVSPADIRSPPVLQTSACPTGILPYRRCFYQKTESHRYELSIQYIPVHFFPCGPPFPAYDSVSIPACFLAMSAAVRAYSPAMSAAVQSAALSCFADAVPHPLLRLFYCYLTAQCPYAHIEPQRQRSMPAIHTDNDTILRGHGKIFHYSHETRWSLRLPLCRWSRVQYIPYSLFNKLCQKQAVFSVTVFRSTAKQQGEGATGCSRLSLRTAKLTAPYRPQLYQRTGVCSVI